MPRALTYLAPEKRTRLLSQGLALREASPSWERQWEALRILSPKVKPSPWVSPTYYHFHASPFAHTLYSPPHNQRCCQFNTVVKAWTQLVSGAWPKYTWGPWIRGLDGNKMKEKAAEYSQWFGLWNQTNLKPNPSCADLSKSVTSLKFGFLICGVERPTSQDMWYN